jgi:hypothetical protein
MNWSSDCSSTGMSSGESSNRGSTTLKHPHTLVERQVRNNLAERGETLPDRPAPSQHPTARTVFQLMRNIAVVTLVWAGQRHRQVTALNAHQLHVIGLLGYGYSIYTPPLRNSG